MRARVRAGSFQSRYLHCDSKGMMRQSIGICSWCIDRHDVIASIERAGRELGASVIQLGFFTADVIEEADGEAIREAAEAARVSPIGTFIGFEDEDYSSIGRIAETGGYTPDDLYPTRLALTRKAAKLTAQVGSPSLSVHAATIPANPGSSVYTKLVDRLREVADAVGEHAVRLLMETGREPIDTLLEFIANVGRGNVGINFDPGNLVIYGTDDPVDAAARLAGFADIVHVKDARRSPRPGIDYGRAVPLGQGDVQIPRVLSKLLTHGFSGPILVETRPLQGDQHGLQGAIDYVRSMLP